MAITLAPLPYDFDALEPVISSATLKVHYEGHHRGYVEKLNKLIRGSDLDELTLHDIVQRSAPGVSGAAAAGPTFNAAAQAWNHGFYWSSLRPKRRDGGPQGALAARIEHDFAGYGRFAEAFKSVALGVFGSGWVWLVLETGALKITATANADTPIVHGQVPLLVLDVWEHAYYLDYQSRRDAYVSNVLDGLFNWEFAESTYRAWTSASKAGERAPGFIESTRAYFGT